VNRELPHVIVLPEDDANRQLANGFHLLVEWNRQRQMRVLPVAGGWNEVLNLLNTDHAGEMDRWPQRLMVLLIDFDAVANRLQDVQARIPERLRERVFVLGSWTEPEALRNAGLGSYEGIGSAMADDCRLGTQAIWGHALLRHNANELDRLRGPVCPILFPAI
jgi:hypothetical protein